MDKRFWVSPIVDIRGGGWGGYLTDNRESRSMFEPNIKTKWIIKKERFKPNKSIFPIHIFIF